MPSGINEVMVPKRYSVGEVNSYIKSLLYYDPILSSIWVSGEISNYKRHYSGHLYFTLKDDTGVLKCVMFKSYTSSLKFEPENGMKVVVKGNISVYERDGVYQLYAERILPDGMGELHLAFEQLKKKLAKEGLFDEAHKKPIPSMPRTIGVLTSETGSVIRDIYNVITRRFPNVHLRIYPVPVQGVGAGAKIAKAIEDMNRNNYCDVIILARGGGSLEELWPFNEEVLAYSIFNSKIPVISAVGHETDFTISDYVADLRAPTPSAAAELCVPEFDKVYEKLVKLKSDIKRLPQRNIEIKRERLGYIRNRSFFKRPMDMILTKRQDVANLFDNLLMQGNRHFIKGQNKLAVISSKLDALSPLKILARGYGFVSDSEGKLISSVSQVSEDDRIKIRLKDGLIETDVVGIDDKN